MIFNKKTQILLVFLLIIIFIPGNVTAIGVPIVATLPPADITSTSASIWGSVNPNGLYTDYFFISNDPPTSPSYFQPTQTITIAGVDFSIEFKHDLTGLTPGTTYKYKFTARNSAGGAVGEVVTFTTLTTPSSEPLGLTTTPGSNSITLNWNTPDNNGGLAITGYKIYRSTVSGGETLLNTIGDVLTYTDTSVIGGQTYYYKVSAVNSAGEGGLSNESSATLAISPPPTPPPTPTPAPTKLPLTVTVASDPGSVEIDKVSKIIITVTNRGKEISSALVMLAATTGDVDPDFGSTDPFGRLISNFTGSEAGIVTVKAIASKEGFYEGEDEIHIMVISKQNKIVSQTATPTVTRTATPTATSTSVPTPAPIVTPDRIDKKVVQILSVILIIAGLVLTAFTTIKKRDMIQELGIGPAGNMKFQGGAGITLIVIGAYMLLKSTGLI